MKNKHDFIHAPRLLTVRGTVLIAQKVIQGVYPGVTMVELDELAAQAAASFAIQHPDCSILAAHISVSNLHKMTSKMLERFDDIEPHLPWILDNIDALAPNTGLLLNHIDDLLLDADCDDIAVDSNFNSNFNSNSSTNNNNNNNSQEENDRYALAAQLLVFWPIGCRRGL